MSDGSADSLPASCFKVSSGKTIFAFADGNRVRSILTGARFRDIHIERLATKVKLGADVDDAANGALNSGALLRAAAELDEATRKIIRVRLRNLMTQYATPDGVAEFRPDGSLHADGASTSGREMWVWIGILAVVSGCGAASKWNERIPASI